jgi:hypothetical protein
MKLSEIVAYLNHLESLDVHTEAAESTKRLAAVLHVIVNHELQIDTCSQDLEQVFDHVQQGLGQFKQTLSRIQQRLTQLLHEQEPEYLANSYRLFDQEMRHDSPMYTLTRQLSIDDESQKIIEHRLKQFTDWRFPGMIIGPRNDSWIEHMVPMDPLYVVDTHQDLLDPAVQRFDPQYQRRLRQYVVNNYTGRAILNELPGNQFGVVFAYNYFNYCPIEIIRRYIQEIASKLRPGGSFIMTYNNCDRSHGVGLAERSWMCYTPKRLVVQAAIDAGLELVSATDAVADLSWVEFTQPGKFKTLRGGQSLAEIIAIPQ